jgi:hypothetical protein
MRGKFLFWFYPNWNQRDYQFQRYGFTEGDELRIPSTRERFGRKYQWLFKCFKPDDARRLERRYNPSNYADEFGCDSELEHSDYADLDRIDGQCRSDFIWN